VVNYCDGKAKVLIKNKDTDIKSLVYGIYYVYSEIRYIIFDYDLMIVDIQTEKETELIDNKYSKYWIDINNKLMPKEWHASLFFEELVDDPAPLHNNIFKMIKEQIDKEFEYYDISNKKRLTNIDAVKIGSNWVLCPECDEAFELKTKQGLLTCPNNNCRELLNNPFAKEF